MMSAQTRSRRWMPNRPAPLQFLLMAAVCLPPKAAAAAPTDMPATSLVAPGVWQGSQFPITSTPAGGSSPLDWFTRVRVTDFESSGAPDAHVAVTLQFPEAFELSIDGLDGFGLFFGDTLAIRYDHGSYPQQLTINAGPSGVVGGLFLPATLFSDAAQPSSPATVVVNDGLSIFTSGSVLLKHLELPPTNILGSGITLSASEVVLDFDPDNDYPESADGSFRGVKLGDVHVSLPESLGSIQLDGHDFSIDSNGLDGYVCWQGGVSVEIAGATVEWSSLCVRFEDNVPNFEEVAGTIRLPADYFGCSGGDFVEAQITVAEAGVITGELDVEHDLPGGCQTVNFGGVDGIDGVGELHLGAQDVNRIGCGGQANGTAPTAGLIRVTVDLDAGSFMLAGYSSAAGEPGSEVSLGLLKPNPANLTPKDFGGISQPGILLPATMTFGPSGVCVGCLEDDNATQGNGLYLPPMTVADTDATLCVENLVLDLDTARRGWVDGRAPEGIGDGELGWQGLYAEAITVTLPPSANRESAEAKTIGAHRLGLSDSGIAMSLELSDPVWLAMGALNGLGFVLGNPQGPGGSILHLTWAAGHFELYADDGMVGAFTLPNGPLHHVGVPALPDGQLGTLTDYAMLRIEGADAAHPITADSHGNWIVQGLHLDPTEVAESGVTMGAEGIAFDFDPDASPPGLAAAFEGVYLASLTVTTPEDWGGVTVEASDFTIDGDGVTGLVTASFTAVEVEVGAAAVALDSLCVAFTGRDVEVCGMGGSVVLPLDHFECLGGAEQDQSLTIDLDYAANDGAGVFVASLDLANVPAACKDLSFGGNTLSVGGGEVGTLACAEGAAAGVATTASRLTAMLERAPYRLTIDGWAGDGVTPAAIGALRPNPGLLAPRDDNATALLMPTSVELGAEGVCVGCEGDGFALPPMQVGQTGIFICGEDLAIDAHTTMNPWSGDLEPPELLNDEGPGWMGLYAEELWIDLPFEKTGGGMLQIAASQLAVGNRGVTGAIAVGPLDDIRFGGDFIVTGLHAEMTLVHNTPTAVDVSGTMHVGFLEASLPVRFSLAGDGDWYVELGTEGPEPWEVTMGGGEYELRVMIERLAMGHEDERHFVELDAGLQLRTELFGTGQVKLQGLRITDQGNVDVDGGWYTFDQPRVLKLAGFSYELNRLGFGRGDDDRSALTLGGAFQLQDVLPVQAEVHDMVVSWGDGFAAPRLDVSAIDLAMEVPGVLTLDGGLRWCKAGVPGCAAERPGGDAVGPRWFEGDVAVALNSPPMTVGGKLMVGKNEQPQQDWSFWFVRLDAQLPAGIAIPATGVSLYGFSGGFGKNVALNVSSEFPRLLQKDSPIHPERGALVFQAGTTLGSAHDNGFTLNADADFSIQIPGPVVAFDGQAWILTPRNKRDLPALLRVNAIFDAIEKYFSFTLDARYRINRDNGNILDIGGSAEVLLGEDDWHLYIGMKQSPVTARLVDFIDAQAYTMLGTEVPFDTGPRPGFLTGGRIEADFKASAGDIIGVEAGLSLGGELGMQLQPKQAQVAFDLSGYLRAFLWKFKLGFSLQALVKGQAAKPFALNAALKLKFSLPWPLPDPRFTVNFSWKKDGTGAHRFPSPLKQVVFESETTGQTVTAFDVSLDEYDHFPATGVTSRHICSESELEVPFDSVAKITFARPIDCRPLDGIAGDVRRCDGSAGNPPPNAEHHDDDYFTDTVGNCQVRHRFTQWVAAGGGTRVDLTGGWGGALGADEHVGATEKRRWETFTFRPTKLTNGLCPEPSGTTTAADPDGCAPVTTIPARCRVLQEVDSCWAPGALADAPCDGRYHLDGRLYATSGELLHPTGRCNIAEAAGVGACTEDAGTTLVYAACCLPTGECVDTTKERCGKVGGSFDKKHPCGPAVDCIDDATLGACCLPDALCDQMTLLACRDRGGAFNPGGACSECVPTGACCTRDGVCEVTSFDACFQELPGVYWNPGEACVQGCLDQQTIGACCLPNGSCERLDGPACTDLGGYYSLGECADACPPRGACCTAGGCFEGTALECVASGGDSHWSVGQSCQDACLGSCCAGGECHVTTESDCPGGWKRDGDCGAEACAFGACCTATGCAALSDVQCEELGGAFSHGASCDDVGVCQGMADGTPCCCKQELWPVVCEEADGSALFPGYLVDAGGALYAVDHPSDGAVGRCDPIPGASASSVCPTDDPAACDAFLPSPPVACFLTDGTPLVPEAEELQTAVDPSCEAPPPGPPATYCPNRSYTVTLRTRTDDLKLGDCIKAPEEICDLHFRIAPAPVDLTPYVRWTAPAPASRPVYRDDDVSVQFTTEALCELYSCCEARPLALELRAEGDVGAAVVAGALRTAGCADGESPLPRFGQSGDLMVFDPGTALRAEARYVVTIPGAPGGAPLYRTSFITSRFRTFSEALAEARAYVDGDTVVVETPEALDWDHVTARLGDPIGASLDRWRVSPEDGTVHVWKLEPGPGHAPGDTLVLSYRSEANGRCGCAIDADCPGGGGCVDGRCAGGYECLASGDCGAMPCFRDGPVVLRDGSEVLEHVPLTLQQTGGE